MLPLGNAIRKHDIKRRVKSLKVLKSKKMNNIVTYPKEKWYGWSGQTKSDSGDEGIINKLDNLI